MVVLIDARTVLGCFFTTGIFAERAAIKPYRGIIFVFFLVGGHWASDSRHLHQSEEVMLLPDARDLYAQKHPVSRPRISFSERFLAPKLETTSKSDMLNVHSGKLT